MEKSNRVIEFLDKNGIPYTVDNNPTPEKLANIDRYFKRRAELEVLFKSKLNKSED